MISILLLFFAAIFIECQGSYDLISCFCSSLSHKDGLLSLFLVSNDKCWWSILGDLCIFKGVVLEVAMTVLHLVSECLSRGTNDYLHYLHLEKNTISTNTNVMSGVLKSIWMSTIRVAIMSQCSSTLSSASLISLEIHHRDR